MKSNPSWEAELSILQCLEQNPCQTSILCSLIPTLQPSTAKKYITALKQKGLVALYQNRGKFDDAVWMITPAGQEVLKKHKEVKKHNFLMRQNANMIEGTLCEGWIFKSNMGSYQNVLTRARICIYSEQTKEYSTESYFIDGYDPNSRNYNLTNGKVIEAGIQIKIDRHSVKSIENYQKYMEEVKQENEDLELELQKIEQLERQVEGLKRALKKVKGEHEQEKNQLEKALITVKKAHADEKKHNSRLKLYIKELEEMITEYQS